MLEDPLGWPGLEKHAAGTFKIPHAIAQKV